MATVAHISSRDVSFCPSPDCNKEFYPELVAANNCIKAICRQCMTLHLKERKVCPCGCNRAVASIQDCKSVKTHYATFAFYVITQNPVVTSKLERIKDEEATKECPVCMTDFDAIYYHEPTKRFWHQACLQEQGVDTAPLTPIYPNHILQSTKTDDSLPKPPSPKRTSPSRKPIFEKQPYAKPLLMTFLVISFCAFVMNRLFYKNQNPLVTILGFPFFVLAKLLFLAASGLKHALTEV